MRTGALLMLVGVMRLTRIACARWRISLGLCGMLLVVLGHVAFVGPARGAADFVGLVVVLFAWLKSADPASERRTAMPQATWHWPG
jgi:hypothetical protein